MTANLLFLLNLNDSLMTAHGGLKSPLVQIDAPILLTAMHIDDANGVIQLQKSPELGDLFDGTKLAWYL